jgi:hypothetical protein
MKYRQKENKFHLGLLSLATSKVAKAVNGSWGEEINRLPSGDVERMKEDRQKCYITEIYNISYLKLMLYTKHATQRQRSLGSPAQLLLGCQQTLEQEKQCHSLVLLWIADATLAQSRKETYTLVHDHEL